jgi:hypothetical protein
VARPFDTAGRKYPAHLSPTRHAAIGVWYSPADPKADHNQGSVSGVRQVRPLSLRSKTTPDCQTNDTPSGVRSSNEPPLPEALPLSPSPAIIPRPFNAHWLLRS